MALKAYKYRLYPNKTQEHQLWQLFGASRWVWNTCLAWRSNLYQFDKTSVSGIDFSRELTQLKKLETYSWLNEPPLTILTQSLRDQDTAFIKFFKEGAGYPKFKSRYHEQSIRFQLDQRIVLNNYRAGELLKLPKLGKIKVNWTRIPNGIPKMVTVSRDKTGKYWVSMAVEETIKPKNIIGKTLGIDTGVKDFATLSDGAVVENPRTLEKYANQLKRLQQRLSRQQKISNRRKQTKRRIANLHQRIANVRRDFLHQTSTKLINENQVICIEDLHVKGMTASSKGDKENPGKRVKQKAGLNKSILDVALGEFYRQLEYKAAWYGRTLIKVDRFFASSKTCSCCDHKNTELTLSDRTWMCPVCHTQHDRDLNAAINIETEGLKQLSPMGILGDVRDSGGEGFTPWPCHREV